MCDVVPNRLFQFGHATEDAVANAVLGDVAEPAFDHIQPRTAGGREVDVKAPMSLQPLPGVGILVRGVVMRQRLESAGEQRQALLRPVEGLDLTLLIARQRQRVLGRIEVQPTTSTRLSANRGSFETLNDFTRCGFSPLLRQMR